MPLVYCCSTLLVVSLSSPQLEACKRSEGDAENRINYGGGAVSERDLLQQFDVIDLDVERAAQELGGSAAHKHAWQEDLKVMHHLGD